MLKTENPSGKIEKKAVKKIIGLPFNKSRINKKPMEKSRIIFNKSRQASFHDLLLTRLIEYSLWGIKSRK